MYIEGDPPPTDGDPLWHKARLPDRRQRLRLGGQLGMADQRARHCPAHPVFDKSNRTDGTFSRANFAFDPNPTVTRAPPAKSWSNSDAHTPFPEAASWPRAQVPIAPANWIATSARSRRVAAPTQSLARSHGICTKTPATWPCARRNAGICAGLSPSKENRDAVRAPQADLRLTRPRLRGTNGANDEFLLADPKPETIRPTKGR